MEELIKDYLQNKSLTDYNLLCEKYLLEKGLMVFEYQDDGKTYFRIKIGDSKSFKNIVVSLQDILVFLYNKKENKPSIQKFQSPNSNL